VSNPPYVPNADLPGLPREVREFDPQLALDGGIDGLDAYRRILPESRSLLSGGGWLMVEIGAGQAADVLAIAEQCGLCNAMVDKDLAGLDRVVAARRP
jgi:release factor glutamine methyltransferase